MEWAGGMEQREQDGSFTRCARDVAMEREDMGEKPGKLREAHSQRCRGRHTRSGVGAGNDRGRRKNV